MRFFETLCASMAYYFLECRGRGLVDNGALLFFYSMLVASADKKRK